MCFSWNGTKADMSRQGPGGQELARGRTCVVRIPDTAGVRADKAEVAGKRCLKRLGQYVFFVIVGRHEQV